MTKTQIWVAAFLALFIFLFLLSRATRHQEPASKTETTVPQQEMASGGEATAATLLNQNGCTTCHGRDLQGTQMAPALQNISQNWTRDKLVNYLRNPGSFMDSERFRAFKEQFPGTIMPPFNNLDVKDLGKIADYLMTK